MMKNSRYLLCLALIWVGISISCSTHGASTSELLHSSPGTTTTFILVRHAERDDTGNLSALTNKGQQRAKDLIRAVGDMGVTAIYSPNRGRNRETVQPLADHLNLSANLVDSKQLSNTRKFADAFIRESLVKHAGGVVLWVGNKSPVGIWGGNLKEVYKRLGGEGKGPSQYDDLYIVTVPDKGPIHVNKTVYGASAGRFDE